VAAYVFVMSVSGSVIVYRSELSTMGLSVKRLVDLHENWLTGAAGRVTNGIGALCLTLLCLTGAVIWWPGIAHWRRSLTVDWRQGFARINWDLHSAAGFWCLLFVLMWALSGASLVQERLAAFSFLDPAGPVATWLSQLHFGQFTVYTEAVWALLGLVPAILAFTGVFICWPGAQQLHQLARIAAIRLDPLARFPRNERRRDDLTAHPWCGDLALQRVPARPGFVAHLHGTRSFALELSYQPTHGVGLVRQLPRHRSRFLTDQHRDKKVLLVCVHSNVRGNVLHDRLLSFAALTPRGVNPRSSVAQTTCRVRQHHDFTKASRSFHIVYRAVQ
jgi:hypothetical protein